ncbi:MAG: host attachment protein [Burkholderiaceae bacterium]
MPATWIVVADGSRARIFERRQHNQPLQEIEDFVNEGGRADNEELRSDGSGRFFGKNGRAQGDTFEPSILPKEREAENFSRTIADYLERGRNEHRYEQIYLIAAPKFLGYLRGNMKRPLEKMVEAELAKDISTAKLEQIERFVRERIDGR